MTWNKTSPRWDVSPEWGTFHPTFRWEIYPTWVGYFSSQLVCMPISKWRCYFHCLLIFCFYFKFELLISIHTAKFYKINCTFHVINIKTWRVQKSSYLSEISPVLTWDLSWMRWIHSHINNLLLQSEIHHSAEISLRWHVSLRWNDFSLINSS